MYKFIKSTRPTTFEIFKALQIRTKYILCTENRLPVKESYRLMPLFWVACFLLIATFLFKIFFWVASFQCTNIFQVAFHALLMTQILFLLDLEGKISWIWINNKYVSDIGSFLYGNITDPCIDKYSNKLYLKKKL